MASPEPEEEKWPDISNDSRIKHEILFYSQGPVDGYIIGEHARDLFLHSRLPITVLSKIWNLADVSNDNLLNVHEFVLCMHLIQEVIKGRKLPGDLPKNLKPKMSTPVDLPAMTSMEKEAYVKVFQTVDSKRKGYLEALEVRPLFQASKVKPEILAKVWDLSDVNKDGVLDVDEWVVACHLIRLIKQGTDLDGTVNPFLYQPDKISPISLQARKTRVNQYEEHKQRLMTLKEKRKNQSLQEQKRLDLLKEKCKIEEELCTLLESTGNNPLTADEILNLKSQNTDQLEKLEEIVIRLKKEHEKIRQETVKVILGEQKLQDEIRRIKTDTDELYKRLGTKHTKATKDPDPFHQLYEQRKEERKKSNLSEGEEPEVHYPFKISPFDKEALSWKSLTGSDVFLSNHIIDNNNSQKSLENEIIIENLHEFSDKFIESWSSKKPVEMEYKDQDTVFMKVEVKPEEYNNWLGAGWKDEQVLSSDNPQFLRLHKKLVDLKREMQKLNGEVGGRLVFRNPSDYLARKKEKEEEEQKDKRFPRRSKSSTDKDYVAKRRSYVTEREESSVKDKKSKRGSYTFDHSFDSEPRKPQRRSLNLSESHIPKPVKSDSVVKSDQSKKARAPLPPGKGRAPPPPTEHPKSPAPQPPESHPEISRTSSEIQQSHSVELETISPVNSPRESQVNREPVTAPVKPARPSRKKKESAPKPSVDTNNDIENKETREVISDDVTCDGKIEDNQVTVEEEIIIEQTPQVESGTYTFKQVQIVNPDVQSIQASSDSNVRGILKKKNKDSSIETGISDHKDRNFVEDNYVPDYIINKSEKSLPDSLADTISLTSSASIESVIPPLPDTTPPVLPEVTPPTPVLSRKIEVKKPHIDIEHTVMEDQEVKEDIVQMESTSRVQSEPPQTQEDIEVEEEIIQIQTKSSVQSEAPTVREEVVSPHSQKVSELRDQFFGRTKSPPAVVTKEEVVEVKTDMDVYLNDLKLEAKTKEEEEADMSDEDDSDTDVSDAEDDKIEFKAVFIPGDDNCGVLPTSVDMEDNEIHLISYNTTTIQSPVSQADSAFEDMASSMDNSNHVSLSSTLEDFPENVVIREEFSESDRGSMSPPESSPRKPKPILTSSQRDGKTFMAKANQFSNTINEPPKITIRANTKEMSNAHIQEVDAQRKAVIQTSTVKRKNVGWSDQEVEEQDTDQSPTKPSIEVQKTNDVWRENSKSINGINWEDKPDKVDLYSKNITEETENPEIVDRESIADLSSTRKQWETFYRSTSQEPSQAPKKSSTAKRWEVKLPYKSDPVPQSVVRPDPVPQTVIQSDSEDTMSDTDQYANESAIDREIRLANEREEMLRKEQEERMELMKRQAESKQNFENKNNNNSKEFKTMYHEMTEADRGSELQIRETIIKQEIMENEQREKALKLQTNEESEEDTNESVFAKEIRLQKEREEEFSNQYANGETNGDDITYEDAIATYQHEGESLIARELRENREREEELQKQRNKIQNTPLSPQPVKQVPELKISTGSPVQKQQKPPTPSVSLPKQSYNSFVSSSQEDSDTPRKTVEKRETPIEREIRLARERENELRASKGMPLLVDHKTEEINVRHDDDEDVSYVRYTGNVKGEPSMRKFASSRLQNELLKQKERENTYRQEGKIKTTSEEHIETPMKFSEVPTTMAGPVKRNYVIRKSVSDRPVVENGEAESKPSKPSVTSPETSKEEPKFRLKTGGAAFSYRETRQHAESKIEKELREMREREEELKKQRRSSGLVLDS